MTNRRYSPASGKRKPKADRLYKAALKVVQEEATKIAKALLKSTEEGKVMSTKLLVELAEESADLEQAILVRPLLTIAERLAAEPQWDPDRDPHWNPGNQVPATESVELLDGPQTTSETEL